MAYADYEYYSSEFSGKSISEDDFPGYEKKAAAIIDHVTFGRISALPAIPDIVRDATCAVAEKLKQFDDARVTDDAGRELASESNDGFTVSFRNTGTEEAMNAQTRLILTTIRTYLANSGLMFRGISRRYDLPDTV